MGGSAVVHCLGAIAWVRAWTWWRRLRGVGGLPWPLLGLLAAVALLASGEALAVQGHGAGATLAGAPAAWGLRIAPLFMPLVLWRAATSSPLRLGTADVSWLLTAPGGPRAAFAWRLLVLPVAFSSVGFAASLVAGAWVGLPTGWAWKAALAGAVAGMTVRLVSFGGHLIAVRARAGRALQALAVAWAVALTASALLGLDGGGWSDVRLGVGTLASTVAGEGASVTGLLIAVAVVTVAAALLVTAADGFQEQADRAARQSAQVREDLRRAPSGQDMWRVAFRSGVRSLPAWGAFAGERALFYRVLAQERRMLASEGVTLAFLAAVAVVLRTFAPVWSWVPAALVLLTAPTAFGAADGLAAELEHYHLRLVPMRRLRALAWVTALPVFRTALMVEVIWAAALGTPAFPIGAWTIGALLGPFLVFLAAAAGSLALVIVRGPVVRALLGLGLSLIAVLPAAALLAMAVHWDHMAPVLVAASAGCLVAASVTCLVVARQRGWPD